ncbi:MAG: DNA polymerase I [Candidatus Omnitrophota bacterium]
MDKPRLCLIDANAFCYRAYYAVKGLSTSFGQPTNAIFGFVNFLNKILKQQKAQYLAACFDVSRDTFRRQEFPEYKAQRPPMPEGLTSQIPIIKEIIEAYGIAIYEQAGFEADDLIASLAKRAVAKGLDVVIISSDKDILQLVDEHTIVFNPYKDKGTIYNLEKVKQSYGINSNQIIDFISLAGDSADNIPQVSGIGDKTAARLIQRFKSVDTMLANLDKVEPEKLRNTLSESTEKILLNRSIVKLREDIDLEFDLDELKSREADYPVLYNIFKRLEFKSLLRSLPGLKLCQGATVEAAAGGICFNQAKAISEFQDTGELIVVYLNQRLALLALEKRLFIELPGKNLDNQVLDLLANPDIKKTGHNLKDLKLRLSKQNAKLEGLYFDTMIAAYLLNSSRSGYSLADLAWDSFKDVFDEANARADAVCSLIFNLKGVLEKGLVGEGLDSLFYKLEMPLVNVLADMELTGVALDLEFLKSLSRKVEEQLIGLIERIYGLSGRQFNINSPKQLSNILFDLLKLPIQKKTKTGPSTNEEVLNILAQKHPLPKLLLEYRKLTKIKSTYIDAFPALVDPQTLRIHASFNQTGTQTGRLSSANPNLQNLPARGEIGRQIRKAIVVPCPGYYLLSFDYSQIELRILAHLSGDSQLIEAFVNNQDIHVATASLIYGLDQKDIDDQMREVAKRINFGIVYGLSSFGLSRDLGISQEAAASFIDAYFLRYSKVKDYIQDQIKKAKNDGYVVTILGRRRYIPEINSKNAGIRQFAERQAINTPVQGSAADLIKKAMIDIHCRLSDSGLESKLILQIHDELVFQTPESESDKLVELVRQKMEGCFTFKVPLRVVVKKGKNWLEMQEVK